MMDESEKFVESGATTVTAEPKSAGPTTEEHDLHLKDGSRWSVFQNARDAMVICTSEGNILKLNVQTERMFGYEKRELVGRNLSRIVPILEQPFDSLNGNCLSLAWLSTLNQAQDVVGLRKDGTELPIEIRSAELHADEGTLIIGIIRHRSGTLRAEILRRQAELEKTIAQLSSTFVNLPSEQVDEEVERALGILGCSLDADRLTVGLVDETSNDILITHTWADEGIERFPTRLMEGMFPWLMDKVLAGEVIRAHTPSSLPPEAKLEKEYMDSHGVNSSMVVPFRVGRKVIGAMACDSFRQHQAWDDQSLSVLQRSAEVLANALARKNADERLQRAYLEIQALKDQLERENSYLRQEISLDYSHEAVVGHSAAIRGVLKKAEQVASSDTTVLILGETGTGKELIARAIHDLSSRSKRPMVKTNCAALPATLIESELFGREKGAYTGALAREIGRFELAHESTIFLDEIGELPPEVQSKLLRVLQEGEIERLGSSRTLKVNVRVIAATSRNLDQMIKDGKFRQDLYYRLNVFPIVIPPLRERTEDIPALVWHILNEFGRRMGRKIEGVQSSTMRAFQSYTWPGNVRELRNVIERNLILNVGPIFKAELPEVEQNADQQSPSRRLEEVEAEYLRKVLQATKWRVRGKGGAAEIIGLKPTTLESRMKKLQIHRPE